MIAVILPGHVPRQQQIISTKIRRFSLAFHDHVLKSWLRPRRVLAPHWRPVRFSLIVHAPLPATCVELFDFPIVSVFAKFFYTTARPHPIVRTARRCTILLILSFSRFSFLFFPPYSIVGSGVSHFLLAHHKPRHPF